MTLASQANDPNNPPRTQMRKVFAPAKVNLTLKILGQRPDSYHELESLVLFATDAADELTVTPANKMSLEISGPCAQQLDNSQPNLIATACEAVHAADNTLQRAHIKLEKHLPVAGGIGGGSADAAAALRALMELNPEKRNAINWHAIARHVGSDVPICLESRATIMRGTGEQLQPLPNFPTLHAVLVNPNTAPPSNKTAQVFKSLNARAFDGTGDTKQRTSHLTTLSTTSDPTATLRELSVLDNDLDQAATTLMPAITAVKTEIETSPSCILSRLSGAGPTCYGLYPSADTAREASTFIGRRNPNWWVCATRLI